MNHVLTSLTGAAYIREFAARLSGSPGVYRMIGEGGRVLYVGKAKHLKKRVSGYAGRGALSSRILKMVSLTLRMEVITTRSEAEALLIEGDLIKRFSPPYNILLKDDKSYPCIVIGGDHPFPQIAKHRGARRGEGRYFGPFASVGTVNQTLGILQRAFLLRPCPDTVFAHRTRPCLQYQIKRCSAPCVGRISREDYAALVAEAGDFLAGKNREVQERLTEKMLAHSARHEYEKAAQCRDRIRALTQVQQEHGLRAQGIADADVLALHRDGGGCCVQVFFFRGGQNFGNRAFYPSGGEERSASEILESFAGQFYQDHPAPMEVLLSETTENMALLAAALTLKEGRKVAVSAPRRGAKRPLVEQALANARHALGMYLAERRSEEKHLAAVAELFDLPEAPRRIEVYDNSHIMGTHAIGAMIVATPEGFDKKSYRRFSIRRGESEMSAEIKGDDYAMLRDVLTRRLSRAQKEDPEQTGGQWPDLLLIDGGKGHLSVATAVLEELGLNDIPVACIAKGKDRNAGREQFFLPGRPPFQLPEHLPVLHYLERLRDEAHRFAIASHRIKRANALRSSPLDGIPGIGAARKKALLHHFGSAKEVATATAEELQKIPGISKMLAQTIRDHLV